MFPNSPIAKKFSCETGKISYLVNFGLAPFFSEELIRSLMGASCFSISYDESFNSETKNEQMDFCVASCVLYSVLDCLFKSESFCLSKNSLSMI